MEYPNYLMHFNKLHSNKNGQFISGDGDSDGKVDEHHRYTDGSNESEGNQQYDSVTAGQLKTICTVARVTVGRALVNKAIDKVLYKGAARDYAQIQRYIAKNTGIAKSMKTSNWNNYKKQTKANIEGKVYNKAAETINSGGKNINISDSTKKKLKIGAAVAGVAAVGAGTAIGISKAKKAHDYKVYRQERAAYGLEKIKAARDEKKQAAEKDRLLKAAAKAKEENAIRVLSNATNRGYQTIYNSSKLKFKPVSTIKSLGSGTSYEDDIKRMAKAKLVGGDW